MSHIIRAFDDVYIPVATSDTDRYANNIKKSIIMSEIPESQKELLLIHLASKFVARLSRGIDRDDLNYRSLIILDDRAAVSRINAMSVLFRRHFYVSTNKKKAFVRPHVPVYGNMWTFWCEYSGRNYPAVSLFIHNCMPHYYIHASATKSLMFPNTTHKSALTNIVQCLYEAFKKTPEAIREHIAIRLAVQKRRRRFEDEVNRVSMELPEYISYMTSVGDTIIESIVDSANEIARRTASNVMSGIISVITELMNSGYTIKPVPEHFKAPEDYVPLFMIDTEIYPKAIRYEDRVYIIPDEIYRKYNVQNELYVRGLVICSYGGEYRQIAVDAKHPNINGRTNVVCDFSASKDVKDAVYNAISELQVCNLDSCFGNSAEAYCRWLLDQLREHEVEGADIYSS